MEELFFQYGRYLFIASSRSGALPPNLQGSWNKDNNPKWQSDYHMNINVQMNFWIQGVSNLNEMGMSLLEWIETLREPGHVSAQKFFNATKGWIVGSPTSIHGCTAIGPGSDFNPGGAIWIMQNVYELYRYGGDKKLLKERIYPIMKELSEFWLEQL